VYTPSLVPSAVEFRKNFERFKSMFQKDLRVENPQIPQ
jgi:hypothetical protein